MTGYVNKEYLESHKKVTIRVEMDGTWSFYHDKKHQRTGEGTGQPDSGRGCKRSPRFGGRVPTYFSPVVP
jgi:hypothetical protein